MNRAVTTGTPTRLDTLPDESRRRFLKAGLAVGGGLVVGFSIRPTTALAGFTHAQTFVPNAFITITSDDQITLTMAKIEMGQGTYTSLPMLIAEELEVGLDQVILRHAPADAQLYGGLRKDQFTGGSLTIRTLWQPMREIGAAARMVLIGAAAKIWNVPAAQCHAQRGLVVHTPSGRQMRYGQLVEVAARLPIPASVVLKPLNTFHLIGQPAKRLDAPEKVNGLSQFGIDVCLPGMLFGVVRACPEIGGRLKSIDDLKARQLPGVRDVVRLPNAVAVIADNSWYARQGLIALSIEWEAGPNADLATEDLLALMRAALNRTGVLARNDGDALKLLAADPDRIEANYYNPMLAHAPMEPINCTVHVRNQDAEIWVGTQVPARARDAAATILGMAPERVTLHGYLLGGAFGRRLETDYVEQAVSIARQVAAPVKITWMREEDIQQGICRGLYAHSVSASLDDNGFPVALSHKIAGPSNLARWSPGALKDGLDGNSAEGSTQFSYDIPNYRSEFIKEDGPIVTGFWRGVGATRNLVVLESFIDELAAKTGKDPLQYRLAMLKKNQRAHRVLSRAAEIADWGQTMAANSGRGIALLNAWDTYMAQVVDVSVSPSGSISVQRVVCVVDCGVVVNPDTVVAQMEGGINFGLTAALYGNITLENGRVQQSNFHDYPILRMNQSPQIDVEIIASNEAPGGVGESGTAGVGGAFVNAVSAATGKRFYTLPIKLSAASAGG
jgi:isoquinoline 1-oxidoreductase beta subunit